MNVRDLLNEGILYYPSIEINNLAWLKSALCIWERVYRIVPENVEPNDSPEVKMAVKEGIIRNLTLERKEITKASEDFIDFISGLTNIPAGLIGSDEDVINLHKDKVDNTLYPMLKELAYQIDGDWIKLSPEIAHGYMLFLADSISKSRKLPKITDEKDVFAIIPFFEQEGNFDEWIYALDRELYYNSVIFPILLPGGVTRVEIENILRFREGTREFRNVFRKNIEEFVEEVKDIESPEYIKELAFCLKQNMDKHNKGLLERAKDFAINLIPSILAVGVPTTLTAMGVMGLAEEPFKMKNLMNSAYIGSISAMADATTKKYTWTPKSASYYLKLNSRFYDGENFDIDVPKFDKVLEEFIND